MGLVCVVNFFPVVTIAGVSTSARKSTMIFPLVDYLDLKASIKHLYLKSAKDSTFQLIGGVAYWLRHRICSASSLGTPIMSKGFQAKISRVDDDLLLLERVSNGKFLTVSDSEETTINYMGSHAECINKTGH
ncbi:hypothetical protein Tco_0251974 [Tanacetum coccineum]